MTLSSENGSNWEFLTGEDVLPENRLLEKAVVIKRFEYLLLGWIEKINWHCRETISKIKQGLWVW